MPPHIRSLFLSTHAHTPLQATVWRLSRFCAVVQRRGRQNSDDLHSTDISCLRRVCRIRLRTDRSVLIDVLDDWKGGVFESRAIHVHLIQAGQVPDMPVS